jgi:hypothetical protein
MRARLAPLRLRRFGRPGTQRSSPVGQPAGHSQVRRSVANEEVAGKAARDLSDDEVLRVLAREARRRSRATLAVGNRPVLSPHE